MEPGRKHMATYTTNLNLEKPSYDDPPDIEVVNSNMDVIDGAFGEMSQDVSDALHLSGGTMTGDIEFATDTEEEEWTGSMGTDDSHVLGKTPLRGSKIKVTYHNVSYGRISSVSSSMTFTSGTASTTQASFSNPFSYDGDKTITFVSENEFPYEVQDVTISYVTGLHGVDASGDVVAHDVTGTKHELTKKANASEYLPLTGGTLYGDLRMDRKIQFGMQTYGGTYNVGRTYSISSDAVIGTKAYVYYSLFAEGDSTGVSKTFEFIVGTPSSDGTLSYDGVVTCTIVAIPDGYVSINNFSSIYTVVVPNVVSGGEVTGYTPDGIVHKLTEKANAAEVLMLSGGTMKGSVKVAGELRGAGEGSLNQYLSPGVREWKDYEDYSRYPMPGTDFVVEYEARVDSNSEWEEMTSTFTVGTPSSDGVFSYDGGRKVTYIEPPSGYSHVRSGIMIFAIPAANDVEVGGDVIAYGGGITAHKLTEKADQSDLTDLATSVSNSATVANTSVVTDWSFENLASLGVGNYFVQDSQSVFGWMHVVFRHTDRLGAIASLDDGRVYVSSGTQSNFTWQLVS